MEPASLSFGQSSFQTLHFFPEGVHELHLSGPPKPRKQRHLPALSRAPVLTATTAGSVARNLFFTTIARLVIVCNQDSGRMRKSWRRPCHQSKSGHAWPQNWDTSLEEVIKPEI
ncbi:hypothetical protein SNOG_14562 [Parastagonospora nodorum SN15]|uniref:Uncharacterized protein n=1 Tax=Phaeosphaeria nodorum (strain SN15 / ATCC MYA-4574 / FGSC 10173) TaxID=321614 RepID=Q0U143_PHANO|nr:hypothetical protein SNOG_14562 [Parastagonospora nodorum SN15]EAT78102.1 hypothetical protein SNOG_14562 [Parastagonospora nodorum SN15]